MMRQEKESSGNSGEKTRSIVDVTPDEGEKWVASVIICSKEKQSIIKKTAEVREELDTEHGLRLALKSPSKIRLRDNLGLIEDNVLNKIWISFAEEGG